MYSDEVKKVCQSLKISHQGNKENLKAKLLNYGKKKTTMFLGAKTPDIVLRETIVKVVKNCVCLKPDVIEIFDRIIMLLNPVLDPTEKLSKFFFTISNVLRGEIFFPNVTTKFFPIFRDKTHLMRCLKIKLFFLNLFFYNQIIYIG